MADRIQHEQVTNRIPSISAAWVREGRVRWQHAVGTVDARRDGDLATPDTQYRIGSITKTFVAVLVMRLAEAGRLEIDDPLERHLPDTPIGQVTIEQLLSQSSGLRAETEEPWWERTPGIPLPQLIDQLALRGSAVGRFHYSNVGFGVLGAVIERLSGAAWTDCLRDQILIPLGMSRTTLRPAAPWARGLAVHPFADVVLPEPEHDAGPMAPAGQLWSTTSDLARFIAFLSDGDGAVLNAAGVAAMRRPRSWHDVPGQCWTRAYGLGLEVFNDDGRRMFGHGGSMPGFQAAIRFQIDGNGVVVLANTTNGLSGELVDDLFDLIDCHEPARPAPWCVDADQRALLELTGEWFWGPTRCTVRAQPDGGLELAPVDGGRGAEFRPDGADAWLGQSGYYLGERLRVIRQDGRPAYLDLASFRFTRTPYAPDGDVPGGVDPAGWR